MSASATSSSSSKLTIAQQVDSFSVYEEAVQTPLIECNNLSSLYYNAQPIGSPRPDARILREDFSSTCAVATHWLLTGPDMRSQAVDIDLDALKIGRRRLDKMRHPVGEEWRVKLLQHEELNESQEGSSRWIEDEGPSSSQYGQADEDDEEEIDHGKGTTWEKGATTDRFERRFQARQAKMRAKNQKDRDHHHNAKASCGKTNRSNDKNRGGYTTRELIDNLDDTDKYDVESPHLMLIHSSVLSLPVPTPPSSQGTRGSKVQPPDIVASLNYALSYFHKRKDLVEYLTSVRKSLRKETGVLICDQFAGPLGEAARQDYGQGRELTAEEEDKEQEEKWQQFALEPGFLRRGESVNALPPKLSTQAGVQVWKPAHLEQSSGEYEKLHTQDGANPQDWPRERLSLVRTGSVPLPGSTENTTVDFEYWRSDSPLDLQTNRFRMSLSFRFVKDGSWIRDFFSYDFRFWTMAEVLEAMKEAGFGEVTTEVMDRGAQEEEKEDGHSSSEDEEAGSDDEGGDMNFLLQTEREERKPKATYRTVEKDEKVFARRSFGTYIVARAPP